MAFTLNEIGEFGEELRQVEALPEGGQVQGPRAGWRLALSSFIENKLAVVGTAIIVFFVLFCFVGPLIYRTNQTDTNIINAFASPSGSYPLGTDNNGFDELGRIMVGGQAALEIGFFSSAIATVLGTLVGAIAGLLGGFVDALLMRIVDVLLSLPLLFVILILGDRYNGTTVITLSLIIGVFSWLVSARLVRGEVLSLRVRDFVLAARTMGAGRRHLIYKHLIPNALGVVIVNITFQVADAINLLAVLGFLGFGLHYPEVSWGDMLSGALSYLQDGYWWIVYPVGACLVLVVMACNFVGDALRDTVDVRLRRR
ncbi:MAG TPA: ABC transporter permease [Acidimicrobiales bacterium]|nr:ABC transporter permease [Acidimicrobiales bacterium]